MKRILCVEDEKEFAENITQILNYEGYETMQASDGQDGLAKMNKFKPDLIICDVNMPNMNGYDFAKMVRTNKDFCSVPIVMVTARDTKEDIIEGKNSLVDEYFIKPIDINILLASISSFAKKIDIIQNNNFNQIQLNDKFSYNVYTIVINDLIQIAMNRKDEKLVSYLDDINFMLKVSIKQNKDFLRENLVFSSIDLNKFINIILNQYDEGKNLISLTSDSKSNFAEVDEKYFYVIIKFLSLISLEYRENLNIKILQLENMYCLEFTSKKKSNNTIQNIIRFINLTSLLHNGKVESSSNDNGFNIKLYFPIKLNN